MALAALVFVVVLLSTSMGRSLWPDGHHAVNWGVNWVLSGGQMANPTDDPFRVTTSPVIEMAPSAPAEDPVVDWARAHPVGSEVCVIAWAAAGGEAVGYCAIVQEHDMLSRRVLVDVTRFSRATPGTLTGLCGTGVGVQVGDRIWIDRSCVSGLADDI